jgi:hypothetical protein
MFAAFDSSCQALERIVVRYTSQMLLSGTQEECCCQVTKRNSTLWEASCYVCFYLSSQPILGFSGSSDRQAPPLPSLLTKVNVLNKFFLALRIEKRTQSGFYLCMSVSFN